MLKKLFSDIQRLRIFFFSIFMFQTILFTILYNSAVTNEEHNMETLLINQGRSFFDIIEITRYWNASHGGVYVPVTEKTKPNPYLHIAKRDVTADDGRKLTLINPAYMTRQISDLAWKKNNFYFHITSLNPIRPKNEADTWEKKALKEFSKNNPEKFQWADEKKGKIFRYMGALWTKDSCLKCHGRDGYKVGDLRGGISVKIDAALPFTILSQKKYHFRMFFFSIWLAGLFLCVFFYIQTSSILGEKEEAIEKLTTAIEEIKTMKGLIPICSFCKKIRNDSGYWEQLEQYISTRSDAEFTHSMCPECLEKLYPEIQDKLKK